MLSLETAKKLKETGLEWEPKECDFYYRTWNPGCSSEYTCREILTEDELESGLCKGDTFAPRLDQLLAEIEKVFDWNIGSREFWPDKPKYCMGLFGDDGQYIKGQFYGHTPEEAAAEALLWILKEAN